MQMTLEQNQRQAENLVNRLLTAHKGREWDGIECQRFMLATYGVNLDWHKWTYAMDAMTRTGQAA